MESIAQCPPIDAVCENCHCRPLRKFTVPGRVVMWHCHRCDLYQKGKLPDFSVYEQRYHDDYARHRRRKLRTAHLRLARISTYIELSTPSLLDVGCSVGVTLEAAEKHGWDARGVDVSHDAVGYCQQRGLRAIVTSGRELPFDNASFDIVTAWHVIEHVPDASRALAEWFRVLRPGGILAIETPNTDCLKVRLRGGQYRRFWPPEHTYAFNRDNFAPFLRRAGFEFLPCPWVGQIETLTRSMQAYAVAYQSVKSASKTMNLDKAFQVFCRKPLAASIIGRPADRFSKHERPDSSVV